MATLARQRALAALAAVVVASGGAIAVAGASAAPAQALSSGVRFSADSLSAWQVNEVAYAAAGSKGKVVVGGKFTQLRPPAGGAGTVRSTPGLAVLDAATGTPDGCQFPVAQTDGTTATVFALNTSPDGATVYVGGNFSSIKGVARNRVAAIDVANCTVKPFRVLGVSSTVYGLASTASTVYLAGAFDTVDTRPRSRFAAVNATTGALLTSWIANADRTGRAITVSPDGGKVVLGGDFFSMNGTYSHSIAVVNGTTGANVKTFPAGYIHTSSVTKALASDATGFYVGNEGTGGGVFDGRIAIDWATLNERWRDTCLGATQAVLPYQGMLYVASHAHDCGSIGQYPDGARKYFLAQSTTDRSFRSWWPTANDGIGEGIGPRGLAVATVSSGASYLFAVGEFTQINGVAQQGIARFGQTDTGAPGAPAIQAQAMSSNSIQVRIWTSVDADDDKLSYAIYRNGSTTPIKTLSATSFWWTRPQIVWTDTSVQAGTTYRYQVRASDGVNVSPLSASATAVAVTKAVDYPAQVIADGAGLYWRFDEPAGGTWTWDKGVDTTSGMNGLLAKGVGLGGAGALTGNGAATFDGANDFAWNDQFHTAPTTYTLETWFKTSTTRGGWLVGFTNGRVTTNTGNPITPSSADRLLYLDNNGRLNFGVYTSAPIVVQSGSSYNNGVWHHVVATQGSAGMTLYVDGVRVGGNSQSSARTPYLGVWKVGGERLDGWPARPTSNYVAAQLDETAVYEGKALSAAAVAAHYQLRR